MLVVVLTAQAAPVGEFVKGFLAQNHNADKIVQEKIEERSALMLDNTVSAKPKDSGTNTKKRKRMSGRKMKKLGLFELAPGECKYVLLVHCPLRS